MTADTDYLMPPVPSRDADTAVLVSLVVATYRRTAGLAVMIGKLLAQTERRF